MEWRMDLTVLLGAQVKAILRIHSWNSLVLSAVTDRSKLTLESVDAHGHPLLSDGVAVARCNGAHLTATEIVLLFCVIAI